MREACKPIKSLLILESSFYRVVLPDPVKYLSHALEPGPGADPGVLADAGLVEARGTVALVQHLLVGRLEQAVGHLVPVEIGRLSRKLIW